jgi:glycerophosphoryl diester phosphodiesterase
MKIIAHRGDSANFPENTPASWDGAYAAGAFAIETDIRRSSDGVCVCAHDPDLDRLFGRSEQVSALPFAELMELRNAEGGRIAPAEEALAYAAAGKPVLLDIKDETDAALERLWQAIADNVPAAQRGRVFAGCHGLEAVRFFAGKGAVGILGFIPSPDDAVTFWAAGATIIRLWERDVSPERVAELRGLGAEIWATAGGRGTAFEIGGDTSAVNLRHLARTGIGGVLVNDVKLAADIMETMK